MANSSSSSNMTTMFYTGSYLKFIEIATSERKNFIEQIKAPIFLEAVSALEIM